MRISKKLVMFTSLLVCLVFLLISATNIKSNSLTHNDLVYNHGFSVYFDHFRVFPPWYRFGPMTATNVSWPSYMYPPNETNTFMYNIVDDNTIEIMGQVPLYVGAQLGLTANTKIDISTSPLYEGGTIIDWDTPTYFGGNTRFKNFRIQGEIIDVDLDDPNYILRLNNYYNGYKLWDTFDTPDPGADFHRNYVVPVLYRPYSFYIKQVNDNFYREDMVVNIIPEELIYITSPDSDTGGKMEELVIFVNDSIELNMETNNNNVTLNDVTWSVEDSDFVDVETLNNSSQILLRAKDNIGSTKVTVTTVLDSGFEFQANITVFIIDVQVPNDILRYAVSEPFFQNINVLSTFPDLDYAVLDMNIDYVDPDKNLFDFANYSIFNFANFFMLELTPLAITTQNTLAELNARYTNVNGIVTQKKEGFHIMLFDPRPDAN